MALDPEQQKQVDALKRMAGKAVGDLTDDQLWELIQVSSSLNAAAAQIWSSYAASVATLVDMSEGSSRRNLGDLYEQALKMAAYFDGQEEAVAMSIGVSGSRKITRPGQ